MCLRSAYSLLVGEVCSPSQIKFLNGVVEGELISLGEPFVLGFRCPSVVVGCVTFYVFFKIDFLCVYILRQCSQMLGIH